MFRRMGCLSTFLIYCRHDHIRLVATSFNSFFLGMQQISTGLKYVEVARLFAESQKMKHLFLHPYLKAGQLGFPYDDGPLLPSMFNVIASPPPKKWKSWTEHAGTIMNFTSWNNSSIFWGSTIYIDYEGMWHVNVLSPYPCLAWAPIIVEAFRFCLADPIQGELDRHLQNILILLQCEAPKIAKLVNITPITMVYGTYNYSYWGL